MGFYQAQKIEKLESRIAELEALLSDVNTGYAECIATREDYRARIAALEAENAELKNALRKWRIILNQDGAAMKGKE